MAATVKTATIAGKTELIVPLVHLNGTSAQELIQQLDKASTSVGAAIHALGDAGPHGRDYYPYEGSAIYRARDEHDVRITALRRVQAELEAILEAVVDQRDARKAGR